MAQQKVRYSAGDEEELMAHPNGVGLKPNVLKMYKAGTLTIADVLKLQPLVIIKNTK
jgi:hypothetical protein